MNTATFLDTVHMVIADLPPLFPLTEDALLFYFINAVLFSVVFRSLAMVSRLVLNKKLAHATNPYASTHIRDRKILILGDSTAVGAGADLPEDTLAGRLGRDFPHIQIVNHGINGGLIRDLVQEVKKARGTTYEMIIISAGGNDVWHLTRLSAIQKILDEVFVETTAMSNGRILFLLYNNIADAPIFPEMIRGFLRWRGEKVQNAIRASALKHQIPVIELFTQEENNPFLKKPEELFARDGAHPSSQGYALWYQRMWRQMIESGYYFK